MLDPAACRPRRKAHVVSRPLGTETVLYDPETRKVHVLNPTSQVIWELCTGDASLGAIEQELRQRFSAGADVDVRADVEECLLRLRGEGLLLLEDR